MNPLDAPDYVNRCCLCGWPEGQPWLTVRQAATSLAIAPRKVRKMIHCGVFEQVIKLDNEWRIHHEALDAFIAGTQELLTPQKKNPGDK